MTGDTWYCGFVSLQPEISLLHPDSTSMARAENFKKECVREFFEVLCIIVDNYKLFSVCVKLLCLQSRNRRTF
jgi:hypothetical protein